MGICSSSVVPPPNPLRVDISHFDVQRVVGKGGFGKVNAVQKYDQPGVYYAMKRMEKAKIIEDKSIDMIWTEREIMSRVHNPFVCDLKWAFQDEVELFFVMPFMSGGDLRYHLQSKRALKESECQFYAAEMCVGLQALHDAGIVYRDLKPDNTLLDADGHIMLSDFGIAAVLERNGKIYQTKGRAGTRGYQAPELLDRDEYDFMPDFWSFGITVYEMLHGNRPFVSSESISSNTPSNSSYNYTICSFSPSLSNRAVSFITGLLTVDPSARLGYGKDGWQNVRTHAFFDGIDWSSIQSRQTKPPFTPDPNIANFSVDHVLEEQLLYTKPKKISLEEQKLFADFCYNTTSLPLPTTELGTTSQVPPSTTQLGSSTIPSTVTVKDFNNKVSLDGLQDGTI